jgi:hypothetical protein
MNIYTHVLFNHEVRIDKTLEKELLKSQFELSGFFTQDNLIVQQAQSDTAFSYLRPPRAVNFNASANILVDGINSLIDGNKTIIQESVTGFLSKVTAVVEELGDLYYPVASELTKKEQKISHLETLAIGVKNKFDVQLITDLLGKQIIRYDKNRDGTYTPDSDPDLATDSKRPIATQSVDLTAAGTGKELLEQLRKEVRISSVPKQDMKLLNSPIHILLPISALEAYHTALQTLGAKSIDMRNNIFTYAEFTFVGFPTELFPKTLTEYTAIILPKDSIKFILWIDSTSGTDPLDIFVSPYLVREEQQPTSDDNESSCGYLLEVSKVGTAIRYRPEFIQQWNIPINFIP